VLVEPVFCSTTTPLALKTLESLPDNSPFEIRAAVFFTMVLIREIKGMTL
jgi:hypothetical protein